MPNHWVITSYEKLENSESLYSSPLITKRSHLLLNSNEPNSTTNPLKTQEPKSALELARAEKKISSYSVCIVTRTLLIF